MPIPYSIRQRFFNIDGTPNEYGIAAGYGAPTPTPAPKPPRVDYCPRAVARLPYAVVAYRLSTQAHCPSGTCVPSDVTYASDETLAETLAEIRAEDDPSVACVRTFRLDTTAPDPWGRFRYVYDTFRTGPHVTADTFA